MNRRVLTSGCWILGACSFIVDASGEQCSADSDCVKASSGKASAFVCRERLCVSVSSSEGQAQAHEDAGAPTTFPLAVDEVFVPSGYMGDGEKQAIKEGSCKVRAGKKRGHCHRFVYTPLTGWGGVFWQYPANNWGSQPGFDMPQGATTVSAYAWSDSKVEIRLGAGILAADGFAVSTDEVTLSETPKRFEIDVSHEAYRDVSGAFGWNLSAPSSAPITLYFDDIVWTKTAPEEDR